MNSHTWTSHASQWTGSQHVCSRYSPFLVCGIILAGETLWPFQGCKTLSDSQDSTSTVMYHYWLLCVWCKVNEKCQVEFLPQSVEISKHTFPSTISLRLNFDIWIIFHQTSRYAQVWYEASISYIYPMYIVMYTYSFMIEYTELDLHNIPSRSRNSIDVN